MKCKICGEEIKDFEYVKANSGFVDEYIECKWCHPYNSFRNMVTCDNCDSFFDVKYLVENLKTSLKDICPYCGKVYYNEKIDIDF